MSGAGGICQKVVKLFGVLHILLAAIGLYVIFVAFRSAGFLHDNSSTPLVVESFLSMTACNILLIAAVAVAGYRLLRSGPTAITFSNLVFLSEIAYLLLLPILLLVPQLRPSIASATGIGNVGVMVQFILLYPVISLAGLTVCRGRLLRQMSE